MNIDWLWWLQLGFILYFLLLNGMYLLLNVLSMVSLMGYIRRRAETGEIARFMTVPNGAEVTGLCFSLDKSVAFVGVQHPGGAWPDGEGAPRSSIVAVWREDGATIG